MHKGELHPVKHQIMSALIELMKEGSYSEITVTDIVAKAEVARASFYRNFTSISDVMDAIADGLSASFLAHIYPVLNSPDPRKMRDLLFRYFYRLSDGPNHITDIDPQNRTVLLARIDSKMKTAESAWAGNSIRDQYMVFAKLGVINSVAKRWLNGGMKETPEEIIDYIMSCISSF